jgi:hypothetical protein
MISCAVSSAEREERKDRIRAPRLQIERLETVEAKRADHQQAGHDDQRQHRQGRQRRLQPFGIKINRRRWNRRRRGARQANEVLLVDRSRLDVEAREPNRRARDEDEPGCPAKPAERMQAPLERHDRRGDAERDYVRKRVEFDAELAGGSRHPRNPAVQHVDDDGETDQRRGLLQFAAHRVDDAGVAAEHVRQGEHARKQVDAAAEAAGRLVGDAPCRRERPNPRRWLVVLVNHAIWLLLLRLQRPCH